MLFNGRVKTSSQKIVTSTQGSPEDILSRVTPALLPGHHAHIDPKTNKPCLISSSNPTAYVQGILFFGQGKPTRDIIHKHYRPHTKRKKLAVEIELIVRKPLQDRLHESDFWRLERRTIWAHVWKWSGEVEHCDVSAGDGNGICPNWTLEDYLAGTLSPDLPMRIEESAKGDEDEDGWIGRDVVEYDNAPMEKREQALEREVVHSGYGRMAYPRIKGDGWFGW